MYVESDVVKLKNVHKTQVHSTQVFICITKKADQHFFFFLRALDLSSAVSTVAVHAEARSGGWGTGFPYSRPLVKSCKNPTFWPIYCILNLHVLHLLYKKFTAFLFAFEKQKFSFYAGQSRGG